MAYAAGGAALLLAGFGVVRSVRARQAVTDRVAAVDRRLIDAARAHVNATLLVELQKQAAADLEPFAERMPAASFKLCSWLSERCSLTMN